MSLEWIKKRSQKNKLWIKKEKMAAHPIAEASITLYLSLPLSPCLTEDSQLGRAAANQESETESKGGEEEEEGEVLPLLILLWFPECFATAASRLVVFATHTHLDFCPSEDPCCHSALTSTPPGSAASRTEGVISTILALIPHSCVSISAGRASL